jgi:hypothetical protein
LRSGACSAVLCWPQKADDRALRRLQVAGRNRAHAWLRVPHAHAALNPSPAPLRIAIETAPHRLRVLKCRGALVPPRRCLPDAPPLPRHRARMRRTMQWACVLLPQLAMDGVLAVSKRLPTPRSRWSKARCSARAACGDAGGARARPAARLVRSRRRRR